MGAKCCNQYEEQYSKKLTGDLPQADPPMEEIKKTALYSDRQQSDDKGEEVKIKECKIGEDSLTALKQAVLFKQNLLSKTPSINSSEQNEPEIKLKTINPRMKNPDRRSIKVDLSRFRLERKSSIEERYDQFDILGKGAFGEVKLVRHKETGVVRAMKIICKETHTPSDNYLDEIAILKQLDHPNVLRLFEFMQDTDFLYLITEYCEGGDLLSMLSKLRKLKESDVAKIMKQVLSAVNYCHKQQIIHRDIKPENILFEEKKLDSTVKVIDFGRSLILKDSHKPTELAGSLFYIAPEVLSGCEYDQSCDIWSCGIVIYLLLSGNPPFMEKSKEETMKAIQYNSITFTHPLWFRISKEAKDLLSKMLKKNPKERISAEEALAHPWIQKFFVKKKEEKEELLILSLRNLRNFQVQNTLQMAVLSYITSQELDSETEKEVRSIFSIIDADKNGYVSEEELIEGYEKIYRNRVRAKHDAQMVIKHTDMNKNGVIDYNEFLMANLGQKRLLAEEKLKQAFDFYDDNKNGVITLEELRRVFGSFCTEDQIRHVMAEADANGDDEITFEEFKEMMSGIKSTTKSIKAMWSLNPNL